MRGQPRDPAVEALLQAIELEPDSGLLRSSLAEVQARRTKEEEQAARELYLLGTCSEPARNLLGTLTQAARELPPNAIDLGACRFGDTPLGRLDRLVGTEGLEAVTANNGWLRGVYEAAALWHTGLRDCQAFSSHLG